MTHRLHPPGRYVLEQEELPSILTFPLLMGSMVRWEDMDQWTEDLILLLDLSLVKCVSLGKPFRCPEPQFSHLQIENNIVCLQSFREAFLSLRR